MKNVDRAQKQIKRRVLTLLKKTRRWFKSEDRLVTDWDHFLEDKEGNRLHYQDGTDDACRACILGGLRIAQGRREWGTIDALAESRIEAAAYASSRKFDFLKPHRLATVHSIYDRAIRQLEKELAA